MAFLTLEDMKGFVEVILFPEVFKNALPYLRGGDPLLVKGILDLSEEHIKIKGLEVRSLPEVAPSPEKSVHLKIPLSSLSSPQLEDLKEVIVANRGSSQVFLHFIDGDSRETIVALPARYRVDPSQDFRKTIQNLFKFSLLTFE
jgi:DNA polymerase-3 subunit alpha